MDRQETEAVLERVVREHRFTIAVVFPLVGAVLIVASARGLLPALLAFNPVLLLFGIAIMRLPLIAGLAPITTRRTGLVLLGTTAYVYGIELVGVATGWPYGAFRYGIDLGPMVSGIPLGLPLFFLPLVLDAYLLSLLLLGDRARYRVIRVPVTVALVIAIDLVLDPAAVAVGFWTYLDGGFFYDVPASNFAGWLLSGTVAVLALDVAFPHERLAERLRDCEFVLDDLVSFVLLWGAINAVYANWIPAMIAVLLALPLRRTGLFETEALGAHVDALVDRGPRL